MDLENFDIETVSSSPPTSLDTFLSSDDALDLLDNQWYNRVTRRARWMDLISDYAGSEPFVIDGESLFQYVLDDPLIAIGVDGNLSFQILHAFYSLERTLKDFLTRGANFDIVFWQMNHHATLRPDRSAFTTASRSLARTLLFRHLLKLDIDVHVFEHLSDPLWLEYEARKKPMFVMANDGGVLEEGNHVAAHYILTQRIFLFHLLSQGIAVTMLAGAEFRDSKVLSFVYEQRLDSHAKESLPPQFWLAVADAAQTLNEVEMPSSSLHLVTHPDTTIGHPNIWFELSRKLISSAQDFSAELLFIFLLHSVLLDKMPVADRARSLEALNPELSNLLATGFLPRLFSVASSVLSISNASFDVDGRVFVSLIRFLVLNHATPLPEVIDRRSLTAVNEVWKQIGTPPVDISRFSARFPMPSPILDPPPTPANFHLLPFSNPIFEEALSSVHVPVDEAGEARLLSSSENETHLVFAQGTLFSDVNHWHNNTKTIMPAHLGGSAAKPMDARQRQRKLRSDQRFMASMQVQAATLTGALGGALQQIVIPPVGKAGSGSHARNIDKERPKHVQKNKKTAEKLSSADKLRAKIQEQKDAKGEDSSQAWWAKQSTDRYIGMEMRLYKLHLELVRWVAESDPAHPNVHDAYSLSVMRNVKDLWDRSASSLTSTITKILTSVIQALGFGDHFPPITPSPGVPDKSLSFDFIELFKKKSRKPYYQYMVIREHPIVWQLRLFGQFMDRSMDSAPDRRVGFDPDAWQGQVLDAVDRKSSLLVVAPTSAGKTFVSFYAMERVLRDSDDGILVYVAPTKALVAQIAAEVYARFNKNMDGKSFWAILTRDYRVHDSQQCQILVTVPEMLAIMLLSPTLARTWTSRIKWIILDEIHSIGQQEGGAAWEQIILFAPCPIIGLSATIGSPEIFNKWLESVQHAHGFEHTFIEHPHRYSHLRKFYYDLTQQAPSTTRLQDLASYKASGRARFLHPIAMLSFGARSLPSDLALEAGDTLTLYGALLAQKDRLEDGMEDLEPTNFFASISGFLRQKDVLRYEAGLKGRLSTLSSSDARDKSSPMSAIIHDLADSKIINTDPDILNTAPPKKAFLHNLIFLVADLHVTGQLPAILFNFDRTECEIMAQTLLQALAGAEAEWRESNPAWQRKLRDWENWKSRSKDRERQAEKAKKQKKDSDVPEETASRSWESSFDPSDPSEQFSFAGTHSYSSSDLAEDIEELSRWTSTPQWALHALARGIAVHHAGMNKRYRSLVEGLFRKGYIRVVIATGTLALGINAPAKTSVFCGDSPFLTALSYRQCAGRAGRRGYDLLGNVMFYGLALDRVQRIILSKLPSLQGNFPLTSTLTLRLLNLLESSGRAPVTITSIRSILQLPRISFGSEIGQQQLLHHLRFSIEYLRQARLIDESGKPLNLFAIAAHLYYTEPSNFALVALFQKGVLHRICNQPSIISAKKDFILMMSHLFGRRYLKRTSVSQKNLTALTKKYPSVIVLPQLSDICHKVLRDHEEKTLRIYTGYALAYATEYKEKLGLDCTLPLSGIEYSGDSEPVLLFRKHLRATALSVTARSTFVANSGHTDDFGSVEELTRTTRDGLHLNGAAVPSFGYLAAPTGSGDEHVLNAHIFDFYTHGQVSTLAVANGIRRGDVWYLLQDFALTLATVKSGLEELLTKASKETATGDHGNDPVDSGYGASDLDPAELDLGQDRDAMEFKRPSGVTAADWRVYEVVQGAWAEFDAKFREMWA